MSVTVIKKTSFYDLSKKYQAWVVNEEDLKEEKLIIEVREENGTTFPDLCVFAANSDDIRSKSPKKIPSKSKEESTKVIIPLSWFKVHADEAVQKKIQQFGVEWYFKLRGELHKDYMKQLSSFVQAERKQHVVYPASPDVFRALRMTPFSEVNVVVIGQDPYHSGAADGLAFSSLNELVTPPSLRNIFKEIEDDVYNGMMLDQNPKLDRWAKQGILLINTCLTVREGEAGSHTNQGWERFTKQIVTTLFSARRPIVWLLWGNHAKGLWEEVAKEYGQLNDQHLVLSAAHPSPLSASRGFFGCKHFSRTNRFLESKGLRGVEW
jgi:uracil-DNA glycosylase